MGLLYTIATKAVRILNKQNREMEKDYLWQVMQNSVYILRIISKAIKRAGNAKTNNQMT